MDVLGTCPGHAFGLSTSMTFQSFHRHDCICFRKPERARIRSIGQIRKHEEPEEAPYHGDDAVDDE